MFANAGRCLRLKRTVVFQKALESLPRWTIEERAVILRVEARQSLSRSAWHISRSQARGGRLRPALVNASWAARLGPSPTTVANVPRVLAVAAARRVRPAAHR